MLGTSLDLSVLIGDAFGSAEIPGGIGGTVGNLWRSPPLAPIGILLPCVPYKQEGS